MLTVLAHEAPRLLATLRSRPFQRAGVVVSTASSAPELVARAQSLRPRVVIVVAGLVAASGLDELARQLRVRTAGSSTLLLVVPGQKLDAVRNPTLYDGLVSLDHPERALARALEPLVGAPQRARARTTVHLPALLRVPGQRAIAGVAVDVSASGACALLEAAPPADQPFELRLSRPDGRQVELEARALRMAACAHGWWRVAMRFLGITLDRLRCLYDLALWDLERTEAGPVIRLHGEISEGTLLAPVLARLPEVPRIDLSDVTRVDAAGVRRWIELLKWIPSDLALALECIPIPLARQMARLPAMTRQCRVESAYLPFHCTACAVMLEDLVTPNDAALVRLCPHCGADLAGDPALLGWLAQRRP
ncbi:MAG TPA: PilZ domain-containing protein [Polyangia bacterium]|nr:PilZ domain-containing protein [Polyangia bacterium]